MNDEQTYESAVARVEEIIRRLDSGEAGLRETLELVKEGRALVEYCAGELEHLAIALGAHDPDRTLVRGYALVRDPAGELVTRAEEAQRSGRVRISFADAAVDATIEQDL